MRTSGIYGIFNLKNGKVYIGSTCRNKGFNKRWKEHKNDLRINKHHNPHLQKSYNKYGKDNFKFVIIERCSDSSLLKKEDKWIEYYKSRNRKYGYNYRTAERHLIAESTKIKIGNANRGKVRSLSARLNIKIKMKGRKPWNTGQTLGASHKNSISIGVQKRISDGTFPMGENHYGAKLNEKQIRKIYNLAKKGMTQTDLSKKFKVCRQQIGKIINRKRWKHLNLD